MAGIGIKANLNVAEITQKLTFLPSLGITALNNFEKFRTIEDIIKNYEIAVYGTILLYKWK